MSAVTRRALFWNLLLLPSLAFTQTGIMVKSKAVVCDGSSTKCPLGHDTCREIDAPVAVGNDSYQNPEVAQIRSFKMLRCTVCGVLFAEKN